MAETGQQAIHGRLLSWAQWLTTGGTAVGYPTTNVLHQNWMPPTPGGTPTLRSSPASSGAQRETHRCIGALTLRLSNTLVVHYIYRGSLAEQACRLGCQPSTVAARVAEARRLIGLMLVQKTKQTSFKSYS